MIADRTLWSIGLPGRDNPQLVLGECPINCFLGCGDRLRFDRRLALDHHARNRRRPFPHAALDALKNGIFDVPVFHHEPLCCGKHLTGACVPLRGFQKCRRNDRENFRLNNRVVDLRPTACTALATLQGTQGGSCPFPGSAHSQRAMYSFGCRDVRHVHQQLLVAVHVNYLAAGAR